MGVELSHREFEAALRLSQAELAIHKPGETAWMRLRDPAKLGPIDRAKWSDLTAHRVSGNVFAETWLMEISLQHCDTGKTAMLAVVEDEGGAWLGAIPLVRALRHGRALWPNWSNWGHPNQFNGTPLVRRGAEARFWRGLLAGLDREKGPPVSLCLYGLTADDRVNRALLRVCEEDRRPMSQGRFRARASLHADQGLQARAEATLKPKLRRRLDSLERQLTDDHGAVAFSATRDPNMIAQLIETFLALEASGWKGAAGSALGQSEATRAFFAAASNAAAERGLFEISWLEAGGKCVAMTTQFVAPDWSCGFKRAHDERFARYAPGQLLLRHLTQRHCSQGLGSFDSSAAPGQEGIERLWPDRRELFDCSVAVGGAGRRLLHRVLTLVQHGWHRLKRI